jgi:hypothetical protein
MSDLLSIYTALAAMQVPVNGVIVPVKNVTELPESVAAGSTPIRLLMPLGTRPGATSIAALSFQGAAGGDWRIADLLLLRPAQAGKLETAAALLVRYMSDYAGALNRQRALAGAFIQGASLEAGVFTYPAGGAAQWFGVEAALMVREFWR